MKHAFVSILLLLIGAVNTNIFAAERVLVIFEEGFPFIEASPIEVNTIEKAANGHAEVKILSFDAFMNEPVKGDDALIWPYGSAVYAEIWPKIYQFLKKGGNILVLGGRPFTMEVVKNDTGYVRKSWTNRFIEQLNIIDSEHVSTEQIVAVKQNPDFHYLDELPNPGPKQAFSMLAMMSSRRLYDRNGSLATMDGTWKSILSGVDKDGHESIPLISQYDRLSEVFVGGRWIFLTFTPSRDFWNTAEGGELLDQMFFQVTNEPIDLRVEPGYAFYIPGENGTFNMNLKNIFGKEADLNFTINVKKDGKSIQQFKGSPEKTSFELSGPLGPGLYTIDVDIRNKKEVVGYRQGSFLCADKNDFFTGQDFDVNSHYLTRGGKSYPVTGMTYMASDVHRYYFIYPNPVVWDHDMKAMKKAGVNMLRTGVWTGHDFIINDDNEINEKTMRAFDAWFMTAKKNGLPVQFCFFHMMPFAVESNAPYTDPTSFQKQGAYIHAFADRYKNNPDIIWDLINEPSYGREGVVFTDNTPSLEESEQKLWDDWLLNQYGDVQTIARKWNTMVTNITDENGNISLPTPGMMRAANLYQDNHKPLMKYDYNLFSQYAYNHWVRKVKEIIRSSGGRQMIVTGQDEGGVRNRVLNQFYAEESPFVTVHSWWSHDDLLWDNIMGKPQGHPLLVQETGNMRYTGLREHARLDEEMLANSLERKICFGIGAQGAGFIPWIWNLNIYMHNENEVFIGMHRGDGTTKKEVKVFEGVSAFVSEATDYFDPPQNPDILLLAPLSLQMSAYGSQAIRATQHAVRALHYHAGLTCQVVSEYHLNRNNIQPKLIILPSARALTDDAWEKLLNLVDEGAILLVTGSIESNPHFQEVERLSGWTGAKGREPVIQHQVPILIEGDEHLLDFYGISPMARIDKQVWDDTTSIKTIAYGNGKIINTQYPVELNNDLSVIAQLYKFVAGLSGIRPHFEIKGHHPGVLVYPTVFEKSNMYLVVSETDGQEEISIIDHTMEKSYSFSIAPGRAQLLMINKMDGNVVSLYGINDLTMKNIR